MVRPSLTAAVCVTGHLRYFLHPSTVSSWERFLLRRDTVRTDVFLVGHVGDGGNHPGWTDLPESKTVADKRLHDTLRRLRPWMRHEELLDGPSDCAEHAQATERAGLPALAGHACRVTYEQLFWTDYCVQLVRHKYSTDVGNGIGYDLILRMRPDVAFTRCVCGCNSLPVLRMTRVCIVRPVPSLSKTGRPRTFHTRPGVTAVATIGPSVRHPNRG